MELVTVAPGHQLDRGAAASYARMRAAGMPAGITSAYRTPAYQQYLRDRWVADPVRWAFAQTPEKSRHTKGVATDIPPSPEAWVRAHPEHGWRFTDPKERWHAEYFAHLDQHLTDPAPVIPAPAPADPVTPPRKVPNVVAIIRLIDTGAISYVSDDGTVTPAATTDEVHAMAKALRLTGSWVDLDSFEHTRVLQACERIRIAHQPPAPVEEVES